MARHVGLDLDEIVKRHLEGTIAGAGAAECLLDECPQRQDAFASSRRITPQRDSRQGPNDLNNLRRGVFTRCT